MSNSTYKEQQDNVLSLISKSDAITRARVKNWINMGYYDFVLRELWPFREVSGELSLTAGTQEYPLVDSFSDIDQQNIISVALQGVVNKKLIYWPFNQLRARNPDFDLSGNGVPDRYYLKTGSIGFWLTPDSDYDVIIDYYLVPDEMVVDADEPIIPVAYREALVQYALSLEHSFNTDPDLAQAAMNRYEQIVTLARSNLLSQPTDTGGFQLLGPMDFRNPTGLSGETR